MVPRASETVTALLAAIGEGDDGAADRLLPLIYDELRAMARVAMAHERAGHTLQPTALVHEAYLRLMGGGPGDWHSRAHFFSAAARAMRRILVEQARRRRSLKRGGGRHLEEREAEIAAPEGVEAVDLLALDEALERLERRDRRKAEVVMLRYFAGLGVEPTALALGVSPATVKNEWAFARAWLLMDLSDRARAAPADREASP